MLRSNFGGLIANRRSRFFHALTDYVNSGKGQIKKLKGSGDLRLRIGDYRVRFEVVRPDTYRVLWVGHRREAYRS